MSTANFFKNLPRCFTNRGIKVPKPACIQVKTAPKLACIPVRKISNGSILKSSEKPKTSNDETGRCYKDVCVAEGVVFPKTEKITSADYFAAEDRSQFDGPFSVIKPAGYKKTQWELTESKDKAWVDNTVQEVSINDNDVRSDIVCDKDYCIGEGVAFHKSSVEPNYAPLFDMFDKGVICNEDVCVSEGVVFSRDELNDVATQHVDENHTNDTAVKKNCAKDDFGEKMELFYTELDFLNFDNSENAGNVYWSQAGRSSLDVELLAPLVDVFDKGMVCNEHVCVSEGVAFHKDQLKDTSSNDSEVSAKKD